MPFACANATEAWTPTLAEMPASNQRLAPVVQRFAADLRAVEHVHDIANGPRRAAALRSLYTGWLDRLEELPFGELELQDRIDRFLFERELRHRLRQLDFEAARLAEAGPLLPEFAALLDLLEARRALDYQDGRASADTLERVRRALAERRAGIEKNGAKAAAGLSPAVALRAAGMLDRARAALKDWHGFYADYDPAFTWWSRQPWEALDREIETYAKLLRDKLAGAADPEAIVGDPIGREALVASLEYELIPYTPEELIRLAEAELAWIQGEMHKAAAEIGHADWREALEVVKTRHVAPGEQPRLVAEMAREAVDFLRARDLVTIPELSTLDWRMNMLSPEAQLQAPFFLGGQDVWVAFPTAGMPHEKKLMSLRGNNRHFSRAVVHHELIPGHHLQFFMNRRYQPHRSLFSTPFWGEGWALYWEFRLYELDFAQTPEDKLGMLFWRAHRAARIQFSLGFHLGQMTPAQAIDLLVANGHERENAAAEVRRSFAGDWPPIYQAAYMLGGLQFLALQRELVGGGAMGEREFHDRILQGGTMPVAMVRALLTGQALGPDFRNDWRFYALPSEPARRR
jgi:uncharacterized protein (DUF885 family)